jgi:hypothetical protein
MANYSSETSDPSRPLPAGSELMGSTAPPFARVWVPKAHPPASADDPVFVNEAAEAVGSS